MKKATLLTSILLVSLAGTSYATTNNTITIDGGLSDWDSDEDVQVDNGRTLYVTWDTTYLYLGVSPHDFGGDGDFFAYFDTAAGGTSTAKTWESATHTLPFQADYGIASEGSTWDRWLDYNDANSQWDETGRSTSDAYWGNSGNTNTEIRVSLSDLGSPDSLKLVVYVQWEATWGHVWISWPNVNPAAGDTGQNPTTFTHYFDTGSLTSGVAPDAAMSVKENCAAGSYSSDYFSSCTPCPAG